MAHAASVAVVIPCYNQAHYLGEAIASALAQTHPAAEIVVVDDGSLDATAEVAVRHGARCVRQANRGLPAARNAGLAAAAPSEHVVFLDADDRLLPEALAVGVAALAARPDAAFAVGRHRCIDAGGLPLPPPLPPRVEADHYASLVRRCWIVMPATVMYRRAVLEAAGGFDATFRHAEDYELYLRLARRHSLVDHGVEVAEYRQHGDTLSRNAERMLVATLRVLRAHRPGPDATDAHRAAYRARENAAWYFGRLLDKIYRDLRARRWRAAGHALLVLGRHLPEHPAYVRGRLGAPLRAATRALTRRGSGPLAG
jgi:glycosyltransferase involved in cell wall biosynthesis